ncbi:putative adenosine deaminase [Xylariaceae sp. FL0804]|nr:putative adenosine deaminase [Xylariaceae sp. FL0804]
MNGLEISPFIAALPKVELHVHIEGTLTPALRWRLARKNGVALPYATYEELLASYAVLYNHRPELTGDTGAPTFLETYFAGTQVLCAEDDFYDLAMDYFRRARALGIRYCEPFFDLQAYLPRGVPAAAVCDGYRRAQRDAAATLGVRSRWIMCFVRDRPVEEALAAYEAARPWAAVPVQDGSSSSSASSYSRDGRAGLFHAVGLAANEYERPPLLFEAAFARARADGLHVTMHCDVDQKDAAAHVREAVFAVCGGRGAERIDHGLNALDAPDLTAGLVARGIPLTLCPHAYHRRMATGVLFPKIRRLWEAGVKFCVNSDDPTYMHDVWIDGAMQKVYTYCGFSKRDMVTLVRNAVEISWAEEEVKQEILAELDAVDTS